MMFSLGERTDQSCRPHAVQ